MGVIDQCLVCQIGHSPTGGFTTSLASQNGTQLFVLSIVLKSKIYELFGGNHSPAFSDLPSEPLFSLISLPFAGTHIQIFIPVAFICLEDSTHYLSIMIIKYLILSFFLKLFVKIPHFRASSKKAHTKSGCFRSLLFTGQINSHPSGLNSNFSLL